MVQGVQSIICLELNKTPPNVIEISNESVYGTHLRMLSKMNLSVQMNEKSAQLKNESKMNFLVRLLMHKRVETEQR